MKNVPLTLVAGLLILFAVIVVQLRVIMEARYPAVRAIEALAATVPLFPLLFASVYFTMADANQANFNTCPLTRTDLLYFTVTVFTTVGFGDISGATESARLVVTAQMLLDLLVLGPGCAWGREATARSEARSIVRTERWFLFPAP